MILAFIVFSSGEFSYSYTMFARRVNNPADGASDEGACEVSISAIVAQLVPG